MNDDYPLILTNPYSQLSNDKLSQENDNFFHIIKIFIYIIIIFVVIFIIYKLYKYFNSYVYENEMEKKDDDYQQNYSSISNNNYQYLNVHKKKSNNKKSKTPGKENYEGTSFKTNKNIINIKNDFSQNYQQNITFNYSTNSQPQESNNIINNQFSNNNDIVNDNNDIVYDNNDNNDIVNDDSNEIQNDNMLEEIGYICSVYNKEPQIGLRNIGATCYMNATLQCLSHSINLSNYFLNPKNFSIINNNKLSKEYYTVIKNLWEKKNNNKDYPPYQFKKIIGEMNPLFEGIAANDSKDLINYILETLHIELNSISNNIMNKNVNQYDEAKVCQNFQNYYKANYNSIISRNFYFIMETKYSCVYCNQRNILSGYNFPICTYSFQIYSFLTFPLEEIRNFNFQNGIRKFDVDLEDCFRYYEKVSLMDGNNQMYCKTCNTSTPTNTCNLIYTLPKYLVLIINRGKDNKVNIKLNFKEIIDLKKYYREQKYQNLCYKLYSVLTHIGPSSMNGHFIAFCRSPIDNGWYKFNDSEVTTVNNFQNEIHNYGVPYILFYEQ